MHMNEVLSTLVHEGRHALDVRAGVIPAANPGGAMSLFAEMRAWSSSGNFAVRNAFSNRHADYGGLWQYPRELAINLGTSKEYRKQSRKILTDAELEEAMGLFGRHGK